MMISMKLMTVTALVLTLALSLAGPSWAQAQGPGQGRRGQGGPCLNQGQGPGNANCPYYTGDRTAPQVGGYGRGNNNRMSRGPRGNWQGNQTTPQNPPEVTQ
jgi:hypothetical protein